MRGRQILLTAQYIYIYIYIVLVDLIFEIFKCSRIEGGEKYRDGKCKQHTGLKHATCNNPHTNSFLVCAQYTKKSV